MYTKIDRIKNIDIFKEITDVAYIKLDIYLRKVNKE
jgi:hypothetical protein